MGVRGEIARWPDAVLTLTTRRLLHSRGGLGDQILLKIPWWNFLTLCTAWFSISKSSFCPQKAIMCFVYI